MRVSIGSLALGVAFLLVAGALAYPLFQPPEEAQPPTSPTNGGLNPPTGPTSPTSPTPDPGVDPEPTGSWDVRLFVNATEGPLGGGPHPIDRRLFSTNVWGYNGWYNAKDPRWEAMLKATKPGALRWPSGHPSQEYCFDPDGDGRVAGCTGKSRIGTRQFDEFVNMSRRVGAEPLIGVNLKTGSPQMAADLVRFLNVERGYGIKYWQLGNEPDLGSGRDQAALNRIIETFPKFVTAMRAVDPTIKIVGPEIMTGADVVGSNNRLDWIRPFLAKNGEHVDAVSWHLYPLDSEQRSPRSPAYPRVEGLVQWYTPDWPVAGLRFTETGTAKLRADRDEFAPKAEIWITEMGPDSGEPGARGITDAQVAAVWFADALGRLSEQGTAAVFQFAFDHHDIDDELSLILRERGYDPLPPWYTYWLFAEHWGNRVVKTNSTNEPIVGVHASLRPDGKLAVAMVNKGFNATSARLTVDGFPKVATADVYALTAPTPRSLDANVNGVSVSATTLAEDLAAIRPKGGTPSRDAVYALPPMSVTFLVLTPE